MNTSLESRGKLRKISQHCSTLRIEYFSTLTCFALGPFISARNMLQYNRGDRVLKKIPICMITKGYVNANSRGPTTGNKTDLLSFSIYFNIYVCRSSFAVQKKRFFVWYFSEIKQNPDLHLKIAKFHQFFVLYETFPLSHYSTHFEFFLLITEYLVVIGKSK